MGEQTSTRGARALVALVGSDSRRYVPGSLTLYGRELNWTEKCSARCPHTNECHSARASRLPSGALDPTPEEQR